MSTKKKPVLKSIQEENPFAKKVAVKASEPKAKYSVGASVYAISYHKGKPETLSEAKVFAVKSRKIAAKDHVGKTIGTQTIFSYTLTYPDGLAEDQFEEMVYPSFVEGAKVFAKTFLNIFK